MENTKEMNHFRLAVISIPYLYMSRLHIPVMISPGNSTYFLLVNGQNVHYMYICTSVCKQLEN